MTSINHDLDRVEFFSGVDATYLTGSIGKADERLKEAFAVATSEPSIINFRAAVEAHENLTRLLDKAIGRRAA